MILLQTIGDKRAEAKFHFIMAILNKQDDDEEDILITYKEFLGAIKNIPNL
jgi:hypothetical protein